MTVNDNGFQDRYHFRFQINQTDFDVHLIHQGKGKYTVKAQATKPTQQYTEQVEKVEAAFRESIAPVTEDSITKVLLGIKAKLIEDRGFLEDAEREYAVNRIKVAVEHHFTCTSAKAMTSPQSSAVLLPKPSKEVSTWLNRDNIVLPHRRRLVAEKCWEIFSIKGGRDFRGLKAYLSNTSKNPEEMARLFEVAIKENNFAAFAILFDHLTTDQVRMINSSENLNAILFERITTVPRQITQNDIKNLKLYIDEINFSGIVTISDGQSVHTVRSKKFETSKNEPIPFSIHSLSKVFTGALAILLIKNGVITPETLDRKPLELDPEVIQQLPNTVKNHLSQISLREIMIHKGKLGDYLENYIKAIEEALVHGKPVPVITKAEDLLKYADGVIQENEYSNLGILLVGLAIQHHYNKKYGTKDRKFTFEEILKELILDPLEITLLIQKPHKAQFNELDKVAPFICGSPAGGHWTTTEDLQKLGAWLNKQCNTNPSDPKGFREICNQFGEEFYNRVEREVFHTGSIVTSSAFLSSFIDNGFTISIATDNEEGAFLMLRVYGAIVENMLLA